MARDALLIDLTEGYEGLPARELTVRLRVPVAPDGGPAVRVSLDHLLERIRGLMRQGRAAKQDEDNLVVFRLLQACGYRFWPPEED